MSALKRFHIPDHLIAAVAETDPVQVVPFLLPASVEPNHGQTANASPSPVVFLFAAAGHVWATQG